MYQPWRNEAFLADEYVQAMSPIQRWIYRTLLQAEFTCSERPYLPDNDVRLWALAGCESRRQWDDNKEVVRARFVPVVIKGVHLLGHKKVLEDWSRIQDALAIRRESASKAGTASAAKRQRNANGTFGDQRDAGEHPTASNGTLDETQRHPTERQRKPTNRTERSGTEQNLPTNPPAANSDGGEAGSPGDPESKTNGDGTGKVKQPVLKFEDMQAAWTEYRDKENADISIGLPRSGFDKLREKLQAFNLLARVDDIQTAFKTWLEDRYLPAQGEWNDIKSPLSVFVDDAVQYITALEAREEKSLSAELGGVELHQ
jgi:hypothetical protein